MDHKKIEAKWQKAWAEKKAFQVKEDPKKEKFYVLEMFSYPSGKAHMGHVRNYSIGDAYARYKRMSGFNVLYPMGFDAFGLPAENAAIQNKTHPKTWTEQSMADMTKQFKALGLSYDWDRSVVTCYPEYYKWNQLIFLKMLERGLAYRKASPINWCPKCNTVLANEQVENGKCWRCKAAVELKNLEQWLLKITDYADELLESIDGLEWPEQVKTMQRNWIGKSSGTVFKFKVKDVDLTLETYTTRPDTMFGITFLVLPPESPHIETLVKDTKHEEEVMEFVKKAVKVSAMDRTDETKPKNGVYTGRNFIDPISKEEYPIYVTDYVIADYGTGVVIGVPAHDQRDFEFAKKYDIPIKVVITPENHVLEADKMTRAFIEEGVLVNSGEFDGWNNREAMDAISEWATKQGFAYKSTQYKLRDWLISRQRYWGTPIPIIYCDKCGAVPVPEKDLPVKLPEDVKFTGKGNPMLTSDAFVNTTCPKCKGKAKRETDTMDTFIDSTWYFYRYCSPKFDKGPFDPKAVEYWLPVDQYIGGIEHAVMHLLYARFWTKALRDLGFCKIDEPFKRLLCQGMVIKDGAKMSKSFGNTVDPNEIIEKYGADTARCFILFAALPEKELDWSDQGVFAVHKFLSKVHTLFETAEFKSGKINVKKLRSKDLYVLSRVHSTVKKVTECMESFQMNIALTSVLSLVNDITKYSKDSNKEVMYEALTNTALMLSPFAPHLAEEMWAKLGEKDLVSLAKWPKPNKDYLDEVMELGERVVQDTFSDVREVIKLIEKDPAIITLFIAPEWKYEVYKGVKAGKEIKDFMADAKLKPFGKEIVGYVQKLLKKKHELAEKTLSRAQELQFFEESKAQLEEELKCTVQVVKAEDSDEPKAKSADVMKPGVFVE
ncbi:MAG: leucine--tRNA ligase [archaeon]